MTESKQYHYSKDGNEYDVVVYEGEYGKENGDGYGHNIRTETTITDEYGHVRVTHEDIYGHTVYSDVKSSDGSHVLKYEDAAGRWWMEVYDSDGHGYRQTIDEWDGSDYPDDSNENVGNWRNPEPDEEPIGLVTQGQSEEPSPYDDIEQDNLAEDHLPPPGIQGEEDHTEGQLPLPDTAIQANDNLAKGHLPGLVDEEPPAEQSPPAEPPVQPNLPPPDHGLQENYAKNYGFPGLVGEPPAEPYPSAEPPLQPIPPQEPPADPYPDPYPPAVAGDGELPDGNANGIPGEYGDGPDLDANGIPDEIGINPDMLQRGYPASSTSGEWGGVGVPEETGIDPYALQQPAYENPSTSGDGMGDPYGGSPFEPYVPPEEAPMAEEAPVPEGEDPDAIGTF
jgi:hypothetical protein